MIGIDESREFKAVRIAVLTVSDTRTMETDTSGQILQDRIEAAGHICAGRHIMADDMLDIRAFVQGWIEDASIDVVISTGGTGLTGRDVTVRPVPPVEITTSMLASSIHPCTKLRISSISSAII